MKFKIKDKEYELKYTVRTMIMYENMTQDTFRQPESLTDVLTFLYCIVVSSTKDYSYTFDEFLDYVDEHPDIIDEFTKWLNSLTTVNNIFSKN